MLFSKTERWSPVKPIWHHLLNLSLWWAFLGALVWVFLDRTGVIAGAFAKRRKMTLGFALRASLAMIAVWPLFAYLALRRPGMVWKRLKKAVWR